MHGMVLFHEIVLKRRAQEAVKQSGTTTSRMTPRHPSTIHGVSADPAGTRRAINHSHGKHFEGRTTGQAVGAHERARGLPDAFECAAHHGVRDERRRPGLHLPGPGRPVGLRPYAKSVAPGQLGHVHGVRRQHHHGHACVDGTGHGRGRTPGRGSQAGRSLSPERAAPYRCEARTEPHAALRRGRAADHGAQRPAGVRGSRGVHADAADRQAAGRVLPRNRMGPVAPQGRRREHLR